MATKVGATSKPPAGAQRWHAVSVKPGSGACAAAASGRDRRWLSREAPLLPLPGCTKPDSCRCTYQHHEDRRAGGRRAEDTDAFRIPSHPSNERRSRKDRRASSDE
jgi:hypothetical protein